MTRWLAGSLLVLGIGGLAAAATLKPAAVDECFIVPEERCTIRWKLESGTLDGPVSYVVRDYAERQLAAGEARAPGDGAMETALQLPAGFYEIEFSSTKQRFGIVALPAHPTEDAFYAIDGALSWLVRDAAVREGLLRAARRSGIGMVRERLSWATVHPAEKQWNWQGAVEFDALRAAYVKNDVKLLEMAHDAPAWMGRAGPYPQDLVAAARSWRAMAEHWRPSWGAVEIWNEPDIFFGGDLPADQYVSLAKAISHGLFERIDVPLVGGAMAHCNREYLDTAAENGLLDCIDAFSFHTYGRALEMESLVARYRQWLNSRHPFWEQGMPLWITECGRPWKKGPDRPPAAEDAGIALDIAMKGVEARACGIDRYFAFVYPFYEEHENNFGMTDRRATPLRSLAAYAASIRELAGKRYLGDLKHSDTAIRRIRVFGDRKGIVAVLYTGRVDAGAKFRLDVPTLSLRGIDGRLLKPAPDGAIPVPDGLTYASLDRSRCAGQLETGTPAMGLHRLKTAPVRRTPLSPIVMRYLFDSAAVAPTSEGYRIKATPAGALRLAVRLFNLSEELQTTTLRIFATIDGQTESRGESRRLDVPAKSNVDTVWEMDFSRRIAQGERVKVTIRSASFGDNLVLKFFGEAGLMEMLQRFGRWNRLPIGELSRWTPNIGAHGKTRMDSTPEAAWRLQATFGNRDRWVYPFFRLPEGLRLNERSGLVIRARCRNPAEVRAVLWEGESDVGYRTGRSIIPADGAWHVAAVRTSDLVPSTANRPDPNGRLDLDQVRRISIGFNSSAPDNTLELSDIYLVSETP